MAIPPNIPTSFVPKQAIQASSVAGMRRHGANPINIVAPALLLITVLAAGSVYGYQRYLLGKKAAAAAELSAQEQNIDQDGVREFIRLRDRLSAGSKLLSDHITLSTFFTKLETITLQNVRFNSLDITVGADRTAEVKMTGEAKNFNALAAQSTKFSSDPSINRAIFSGVRQSPDGKVTFTVTATLASNMITYVPAATKKETVPPAPAAVSTTTATTTSAQTTATSTQTTPAPSVPATASSSAPSASVSPRATTTTP